MVKITAGNDRSFDIRDLDFSRLFDGASYVTTKTLFQVHYSSGFVDEFRGSGFNYGKDGTPTGGTVKSYVMSDNGSRLVSVDGLQVSVAKVIDAAETSSKADDLNLIKANMSGDDRLTGGQFGDYGLGFGGNDQLIGKGGNDILKAGQGKDTLIGGSGRDTLSGEAGADLFVFQKLGDSTKAATDRITDFSHKQHDVIDFSAIDANADKAGNQAFRFIGDQDFHGKAGELHYGFRGGVTVVEGMSMATEPPIWWSALKAIFNLPSRISISDGLSAAIETNDRF